MKRITSVVSRRRSRRAIRAILSAAGAVAGLGGGHAALAQVVSSDNQYTYTGGASGLFSTGFTPSFTSDGSGELLFNVSGAAITDDLASASINALAFTSPGTTTITQQGSSSNVLTFTTNAASVAPSIYVGPGSSAALGMILGGSAGLTISGGGSLSFNGAAAETYTGTTTVNNAALTLDYTNYSSNNLVGGGTGTLNLGGGSLNMLGNGNLTSSQTFSAVGLVSGTNYIAVSGANTPTLNLGTTNYTVGAAVVFNGIATNISATTTGQVNLTAEPAQSSSSTPAGTITTATQGQGGGLIGGVGTGGTSNIGLDYATVGLYDWAVTTGSTPFNVVGGSQVASFYTILDGANNNVADQDYDVTANSTLSGGGSSRVTINSMRFNTPTTLSVIFNPTVNGKAGNGNPINLGGMLVTPNVAANNVTIGVGSADGINSSNTASHGLAVWQNNTQGELIFTPNTDPTAEPSIQGTNYLQAGPGTVWFNGNTNSYSGQTFVDGGALEINLDDLGGPTSVQTLTLNGGTLVGNYTGSLDGGGLSTAHPVALGNDGGGVAVTSGKTFTIDGVISGAAGTGALVIGIPASNANDNVVGGLPGTGSTIFNGGTLATANAQVLANGTIILSNTSNSYTGGTVLDSGTLDLNAGTLSVLGTGGFTLNGGTLFYANSSAAATDLSTRTVTVSGNSIIDVNGNAVTYASSIGNGGAGGITVNSSALGGTLTLNGSTFTGAVTVNSGAGLVLNGSHLFSGATTINSGGTLTANAGASLGNTAILDSGTANFNAGSGNIQIGSTAASLALNSGGAFSMADANFGKVTLNSVAGGTAEALALNGNNSAAATLTFDLGATTTGGTLSADELVVNNGTVGFGGTNNVIKLSTAGLSAPAAGTGTVTLISVPNGGLPALASTDFSLFSPTFSIAGNSYSGTLSVSGNQLLLTINPFTASLDYYYNASGGDAIVAGAGANFVTTAGGGTLQTSAPGASNNLFFTANSSADNTPSLDASVAVNSVSFTGTGSAGTLGTTLGTTSSSNILTINAANGFKNSTGTISYAAGVGLVVQAGSGSNSIAANITLGASQSWEIDNSPTNPLTVSGNVAGAAALTKTGSGVLVLSGSNSYSGGTNVNVGTLQLNSGTSLPGTGILTVQGTGVLNLNGNSASTAGLYNGGASTGSITSASAATLTVNPASPFAFGGTISGAAGLTLAGSSTQTLSGFNSYTGLTTISSGTLIAASNTALGSSTSATGGLSMSGTATVDFTSTSPAIASLNGASTDAIVLGNSGGSGAPTTLTVGGGNSSSVTNTFAGVISDLSSTPATLAVGNLTVVGSGTVILAGADTFTGITSVGGAATLQLGAAGALQDSTLNYNSQGGTLSFGTLTSATLGGLTGSQPLALTNASAGAVALLIGNNGVSSTYTGLFGGLGSVIKVGSGAVT